MSLIIATFRFLLLHRFIHSYVFQAAGRAREKRISKEMDSLIESRVDEHKLTRLKIGAKINQDFIDVLLSAIEDDSMFGHTRETIIKATVTVLISAGSDWTSLTLTWILSNLMNNRHAMKRAQEELDLKIGRDRWVEDCDIEKLVYLQAIIKETFRLYPAAPLSVPHEAMEDCRISGYHIPKGARLFVNVWKLQYHPIVNIKPLRCAYFSTHISLFSFLIFRASRHKPRSCHNNIYAKEIPVFRSDYNEEARI
ncbi:protopine 6-monooxygenase-like [Herrania umbratica]|uniref:Protopine 6-monooxygenase-like n=1 Tax=Herrania umbratica TaxID=108875 RepID=A0A6J1BPV2_9ROSI|nr:protopine 6-monooxygenase-like [Herrania umbratica]